MPKTKSNKNSKTIIIILIFLGLFLLPIIVILAGSGSSFQPNLGSLSVPEKEAVASINAVLAVDDLEWSKGSSQTVDIDIANTQPVDPSYVEVKLAYNPDTLTLSSITTNKYWTDENVIVKSIDNEKGEAMLIVGKGFGDNVARTDSDTVATLSFRVSGTSTTPGATLSLDPSSYVTLAGTGKSYNLTSDPLVVTFD